AFATVLAILLRADFYDFQDKLIILIPYVLISIICAFVVFLVCGLDRTPWRYSSVADHFQIIVLTVLVILLTLGLTFAVNRLEGVSRSLPVIQAGLIISILISARAVARFWFTRQIRKNGNGHPNKRLQETILIVGVNTVTDLFLLSLQEFASHSIQVAGIVAEEPKMRGRAIRQKSVLGTVDELQNILQSLEVHGVTVDRIVVTIAADRLPPRALETLLEVEKSSNIVVQFLSERLGFKDSPATPSARREVNIADGQESSIALVGALDHANKPFRLKRIVDGVGAAFLILALAPITVLVAFIVALDVGLPVIF